MLILLSIKVALNFVACFSVKPKELYGVLQMSIVSNIVILLGEKFLICLII